MTDLYDVNAPKRAANLSINSDLLDKSKALHINLSATLESALKQQLAAAEAEKWARDNAQSIAAYNDFIAEHGCFGDEFRDY
ncbi:MAG: hypothetical protein RLZZ385_1639 [Pseudomonadota bacterium]|jgi:antitoxin CcdA